MKSALFCCIYASLLIPWNGRDLFVSPSRSPYGQSNACIQMEERRGVVRKDSGNLIVASEDFIKGDLINKDSCKVIHAREDSLQGTLAHNITFCGRTFWLHNRSKSMEMCQWFDLIEWSGPIVLRGQLTSCYPTQRLQLQGGGAQGGQQSQKRETWGGGGSGGGGRGSWGWHWTGANPPSHHQEPCWPIVVLGWTHCCAGTWTACMLHEHEQE